MPIPVDLARLLIRAGVAQRLSAVKKLMGDGVGYLKYYNKRLLGSPNEDLKATQEMVDAAHRPGVLDLSLGAPPLAPSVARAAADLPPSDGYPPVAGLPELRAAVAERLAGRGIPVDPARGVMVCNGVSQAIGLFLDSFVGRGDRVALFEPTFFVYSLAVQNRLARVAWIPTEIEDGLARVRDADLRRGLRGAKACFVNSPCNPTGAVFPPELLERIAHYARRHDVLLFSDEVYERFRYVGRHVGIASFPDAAPRTVTAGSFSKTYGMAGWRVGHAAGDWRLLQPMTVTLFATAPFVSEASQRLALAALDIGERDVTATVAEYDRRRKSLAATLAAGGLPVSAPGGAFYFWLRVAALGWSATPLARALLDERQVLVLPGDVLARRGREYVRISFAGAAGTVTEGVRRLVEFVGQPAALRRAG